MKRPEDATIDSEITEAQKREMADSKIENQIVHFGKVEVDSLILS